MPRAAPPAPPNAPKSCRTDQGPNRDAPAAAGPEQTGLADRAPAARSAAAAGSPQAARWQVRAAVSDPNCSRPAPGRPSGSGSAGAMSRVSRALREQRGGGCVRLDERRASRAACLSCGLCAQLAWASRYWCTMRTGELGRRKILGRWRNGFLTGPKSSEAPVRPAAWCAGRARSIGPSVGSGLYILSARARPRTLDLKHRCSHGYLCPDSTAVTAESATEGGLEVRTAWDAWAGG